MSTLLTLRNRVQDNIAEPIVSTGWFTPTAVNNWLNAGSEIVFLKIMAANPDFIGVKTALLSYVLDQEEYSLASVNPFEIRQVEITDLGSPFYLGEIDKSRRNDYPFSGEPAFYYWNMDYTGADPILEIGLLPKPHRSATNNVKVHYVSRPRILSIDTDTSDLPQEYQELVILWATILALRADQRPESAWQVEFNFRLTNALSFVTRGKSGGPQYVHYVDE